MMMRRGLVYVVFAAAVPFVRGQDRGDRPAEPPAQREPTAEDILRALKGERPQNEVVPPGSAGARGEWKRPKPQLRPDGFSMVDKTGSLQQQGEDWWFHCEPDTADPRPPMQLLPNSNLEIMIRTNRGAATPVRFTISGELTVFAGRNFLVVRSVARASSSAEAPPQAATPQGRIRADAAAGEVMQKLHDITPGAAVLPPMGPADAAERAVFGPIVGDGTPVVHRVGRLVREGGWWTLVSDSQRVPTADGPLRLLPNQTLETMVREAQREPSGLVFTVSGEATLYMGRNYLLARVALRRVDLGNLRP
jgi:hypothetical protein